MLQENNTKTLQQENARLLALEQQHVLQQSEHKESKAFAAQLDKLKALHRHHIASTHTPHSKISMIRTIKLLLSMNS